MTDSPEIVDDPALRALIERVQWARETRGTLCIRGGDTKAFYGGGPRGEPMDMGGLLGISSYEPTELVVTVRAGTKLAELEAVLAEKGQCLAFEPPRFAPGGHDSGTVPRGGTVGGMVAAGLSGPSRAAVGAVRDHVLGLTLLNGKAEVLSFGGQVMKNVAGYDVSRVIAGSMGVLGAICEVSLKVLPLPAATATLRFEMDQAGAIRQLNEWAGRPLPLHASAWWQGLLVLRLSGAAAAVRAAAQSLGGELVPPELAAGFWDGLRDHGDEYFVNARAALDSGATLWRLSLPPTAPPLALDGDCLIEWGGAQRWLSATLPAATVRDAAAAVGGHATLFMGHDRSAGVFAPLKSPLDRIHRELKRAFDPDGVFNPGRLYPGLCP
ncbi:MAG: glycolate oxidase subunit GlcE [Proteobacteria bacterium]|jgi:glycolate oxidase FAD binding subunit|nr:glycolate oxidase subunit GlcE [Pseudomonadota bacterium]